MLGGIFGANSNHGYRVKKDYFFLLKVFLVVGERRSHMLMVALASTDIELKIATLGSG